MRNVLTSSILAATVALAAMGCEDPPKPQTQQRQAKPPKPAKKKAAKPKVKKLTPQQKVKMVQDCWTAFNAQDITKFSACYSPKTVNEMVDYLPARTTKGPKALFASNAPVRKAFPDMKYELGKIFVRGNDAVVMYSSHGTHKGELMGKEPTDKSIGYMAAHHVTWGTDGTIATDRHYYDQGTFTGQLGMHEMPVRAAREPGKWGELEIVIAKNDKTEKANLALVQKAEKLAQAKDVDKLMELYADDAVFVYLAGKEDAKGKDAVKKSFEQWFKVSSDSKGKTAWSWAAGDYVLSAGTTSGTNDGDLGEGKPATNKKFSMKGLEIVKVKDGKISEYWLYGNGYKFAVDLGLAPDPAAAMADKGDDKGDDKAVAKDAPKDKATDTKAAGAKPEPKPASTPKKSE